MIKIHKKYARYLILISVLSIFLVSCGNTKKNNIADKVDINEIVKEAFTTEEGYSEELSVHMSEEVFDRTNIYNVYGLKQREFKEPYSIDFVLNEDSKEVKGDDTVLVNMKYTVSIKDANGKDVGGSYNVPIKFTVNLSNDGWYIVDKFEEA